jgi:hypothetical protein
MASLRLLKGFVLGTVAVVAGCSGSEEDSVDQFVESPALGPQGGPSGSVGMNGASPLAYHANVGALLSAMSVAAADPMVPSAVNPAIEATGLLDTAGGRQVFAYAARCALPAGTELESGDQVYSGGGVLATTASWRTGGLTTSQKEDALTCMVAHLNPFSAKVPIFLSGPSVNSAQSSDDQGFAVEEAIWQAKIPGPGKAPIYHAWPRANLLDTCGLLTTLSWVTRICGSAINTCGVQVRYDRATACTGSNGNFSCDGKPAIETTLEESNLCLLHLGLL